MFQVAFATADRNEMERVDFKQVDVFSAWPFFGNPVAVVFGGEDLAVSAMLRIAAWTNLSETTFVLPPSAPGADYRLRIFTPKQELSFAGHPSIGSAHAVLEKGMVKALAGRLVQECAAGLLNLRVEGSDSSRKIFIRVPQPTRQSVGESYYASIATALGGNSAPDTPPLLINVGPTWMVVNLGDAATVDALQPDMAAISVLSKTLRITGITVFGQAAGEDAAIAVRSFAPAQGIPEDPVCGSGNACVAAFLGYSGLLDAIGSRYLARQGKALGREGSVWVETDSSGERIEIGGASVTCIDGSIRL